MASYWNRTQDLPNPEILDEKLTMTNLMWYRIQLEISPTPVYSRTVNPLTYSTKSVAILYSFEPTTVIT